MIKQMDPIRMLKMKQAALVSHMEISFDFV